jgi:tRNA(fMet)-specific endonuclease VapC
VRLHTAAAYEAGDVLAYLAIIGKPISDRDTLIAAHARALSIPLVTHNTREFSRIPGLVLEDWLE